MHPNFYEQQARERIGSMMREAAEHRLASQAGSRKRPRILALAMASKPAVRRLVNFLKPMHRTQMTAQDNRPAR